MFAENLKRLRNEKGITQTKLAEMIDVSDRTIGMYERNKLNPSLKIVQRIATVLDVPIESLTNDNDIFIQKAAEEYGSNGKRQATQLITQLNALFAGGQLDPDDIDDVYRAITEAYWDAKDKSKKYTRKDYMK